MTTDRADGPGEIHPLPPPLSAEQVEAIGQMRPPPARADFWDRLQANLDGEVGGAGEPGRRSRSGYRVALLAVAAVLVVAVAGRQLVPGPPADGQESEPAATLSGGPPTDPGLTATTAAVTEATGEIVVSPSTPSTPTPSTPTSATAPSSTATAGPSAQPIETSGAPGTAGIALSGPVRLEAEQNDRATTGGATREGWQLWSNGFIEHKVALAPGNYRITIEAQGVSRTATRPEMELRLDDRAVGSTLVDVNTYRRYSFEVLVESAGSQRLTIAFTNDPNRPDNDVDLKVDATEITPLG